MSERADSGLFLHKRSYRRRRMLDGIKMLPMAGAWLFMMPVLWVQGEPVTETHGGLASALVYVFGAWMVLIVLTFALIFAYRRLEGGDEYLDRAADTADSKEAG